MSGLGNLYGWWMQVAREFASCTFLRRETALVVTVPTSYRSLVCRTLFKFTQRGICLQLPEDALSRFSIPHSYTCTSMSPPNSRLGIDTMFTTNKYQLLGLTIPAQIHLSSVNNFLQLILVSNLLMPRNFIKLIQ